MRDSDVLVVGAGPAGISAAAELAGSGLSVLWIDQRDRPGGSIHRQPVSGSRQAYAPASVSAQWTRLRSRLDRAGVTLTGETSFVGVDSDGVAVLEDRRTGAVIRVNARAIVLAVGAVERVLPRPGWQLPGVWTAGGMQVMLKETGRPPQGRVLVAGNGPLTIALAAQLAAAGNPPVSVLEAGDPIRRPLSGFALLMRPRLTIEAGCYLARLARHRVSWRRGTRVLSIEPHADALRVRCVTDDGRLDTYDVEHVALHDGIRPNAFGLAERDRDPCVVRAGDCRETLGAVAAEADGRRVALVVFAHLRKGGTRFGARTVEAERRAQRALAKLFHPMKGVSLADLPDETVLCRCEGKTVGDLQALLHADPGISPREVKLNGRFGMGACQGRFCADNVAALLAQANTATGAVDASALTGSRWPVRPIAIASLIRDADDPDISTPQ